jgi:predicted nucleic acid-binding protein
MVAENASAAVFVDTNIWLYAIIEGDDGTKTAKARALLKKLPSSLISTQVLNEICVNLLRRKAATEAEISQLIAAFFARRSVWPITERALQEASRLRSKYSLSFWDSLIVATALLAGVKTLYSEDMQHGQSIEDQLLIVNPFHSSGAADSIR